MDDTMQSALHASGSSLMTMREALHLALDHALQADERVFLLGEDIADPGASGPTAGLSTKFGHDRVLDTPISEAAILGAAVGAALVGTRPVVEMRFADFALCAVDELVNRHCPTDLPHQSGSERPRPRDRVVPTRPRASHRASRCRPAALFLRAECAGHSASA